MRITFTLCDKEDILVLKNIKIQHKKMSTSICIKKMTESKKIILILITKRFLKLVMFLERIELFILNKNK